MKRKNITTLAIASTLSIFLLNCTPVHAAVGDCVSWMWGGKKEETTYAPPFSQTVALNGGNVQQPVSPTTSPSGMQQVTTLKPEVKKEWTYSRIKSVSYKPVQAVDPCTGTITTTYQPEETETLLPWLHQKEVVEYKPVTVNVAPPAPQTVSYYSSIPISPTGSSVSGYTNGVTSRTVTYISPSSGQGTYSGNGTLQPYGTPDVLFETKPSSATGVVPVSSSTYTVSNNAYPSDYEQTSRIVPQGFVPASASTLQNRSVPESVADQVPVVSDRTRTSVQKENMIGENTPPLMTATVSASDIQQPIRPIVDFSKHTNKNNDESSEKVNEVSKESTKVETKKPAQNDDKSVSKNDDFSPVLSIEKLSPPAVTETQRLISPENSVIKVEAIKTEKESNKTKADPAKQTYLKYRPLGAK
ncbi:MAG: hypothetical protein ACRC2T_08990 [Thermoguttaceae bacterium]